MLAIGDIRMILLKRGVRYALRVKDNQSASRTRFTHLRWYPIDEDWKITARSVPAPEHSRFVFETNVGEQEITDSPGYAVFERAGKTYKLQAARETDGSLRFVFRDGTSGRTTHGGARQLVAAAPGETSLSLISTGQPTCPARIFPSQRARSFRLRIG